MKLVRPFLLASGAILFFIACSSDGSAPTGGIALTLATDGSISPDRINVKVSNTSSVFYTSEIAIGSGVLPKTVNVTATGAATIAVQAWSGSTPLDRRDLTVAKVPTDRLQPFTVLLSAKCSARVRADGSSIASDCAAGTTCSPTDGSCVSSDVSSSISSPDGGAVDNGSCIPASTACGADGASVKTCNADGLGYGTATSCNGKTCASGACTTCNIGDESCGGALACTVGAGRCTGTPAINAELCDSTGKWQAKGACQFACKDGQCIGVCGPGSTQCAAKATDGTFGGSTVRIESCISGNCADPNHPVAVVVRTCNVEGQWEETAPCPDPCFSSPDSVTVACGYCTAAGASQKAVCLPQVQGSCQCPVN